MPDTSRGSPASKLTAAALTVTTDTLLQRVGGGDRGAFAELYDRVGPVVYGMARQAVADLTTAEDVTADVLLAVWVNAASFDPEHGSAQAWILRHARRRAHGASRRQR